MIETNVSRHHGTFLQVIQSYYQLTKPRIIPLLLITTAGSMWIAAKGEVDPLLLLVTLTGGTLAAASAQTINCVYDRDIDYDMERTRHRPIPSGKVQPRDALIFAIALATISFTLLAVFANLLAAAASFLWHRLLYFGLYPLAKTPHHSEYRCWWGCWGNSGVSGLGCRHRHIKLVCMVNFCHRLFVDTTPFLGVSSDDSGRLRKGRDTNATCD